MATHAVRELAPDDAERSSAMGGGTAHRLGEAILGLVSMVIRERSRDLTLTAVSTLVTLERSGPRPLTQLALSEGVAQPSMTALVAQLEGLGLVERRRDPTDGRVALIALADEGAQYLAVTRQGFSERLSSLLAQLPPNEAAALEASAPALEHLLEITDRSGTLGARRQERGAAR